MNVFIPIEEDNTKRKIIAGDFLSINNACLFNTLTMEYEWISLSGLKESSGDIINQFKRLNIEAVIAVKMKPLALGLFLDNKITVYQAEGNNIEFNIHLYGNKKLLKIDRLSGTESGHCESNCNSCKTACKN